MNENQLLKTLHEAVLVTDSKSASSPLHSKSPIPESTKSECRSLPADLESVTKHPCVVAWCDADQGREEEDEEDRETDGRDEGRPGVADASRNGRHGAGGSASRTLDPSRRHGQSNPPRASQGQISVNYVPLRATPLGRVRASVRVKFALCDPKNIPLG